MRGFFRLPRAVQLDRSRKIKQCLPQLRSGIRPFETSRDFRQERIAAHFRGDLTDRLERLQPALLFLLIAGDHGFAQAFRQPFDREALRHRQFTTRKTFHVALGLYDPFQLFFEIHRRPRPAGKKLLFPLGYLLPFCRIDLDGQICIVSSQPLLT